MIFGLTDANFAEDQSSLAKFVVRNYNLQEVPNVGSDNPDYVIVEFFDYRCGYCSKQAYDFAKLLESHKNVQIIYLEFPIFGGISETASKLAMNVWQQKPDLYFQIHNEFMKLGPKMKKNKLIQLLDANGFDGESMFAKAKSEEKNIIIDSNIQIAKNLGLRGTPASIVNDTIFPGYVGLAKLKQIISQ
jgi:protein-disulfide isomerase